MTARQIGWIIASAFGLGALAVVIAGGMYSMWLMLFFFSILIYQSGNVTTATLSANAKKLKVFAWSVLIVIFLINFLSRMTGKSLDGATNGSDALALLLFGSLLAMFATKEAGWTSGATGKKWIIRLFVATFVYSVLSALFPAVPRAVNRFTADVNWVADSYAERKLVDEVGKVFDSGKGVASKGSGKQSAPAANNFHVLPDGTIALDPGATFQLPTGTKPITFQFSEYGVFFLSKKVRVESASFLTLVGGEKTREVEINPEAHARANGGPPCFRDTKPFKLTLTSIDGLALIKARTPVEKCD